MRFASPSIWSSLRANRSTPFVAILTSSLLKSLPRSSFTTTTSPKMPPPVQTYYKPIKHPQVGENGYQGFNPRKETLPKGWTMYEDSRPLPCDLIVEHDVEVRVRDGCKLYCDIYRPADAEQRNEPIPAIMAWSPYGKKYSGIISMKPMPFGLGVPKGAISGLEKFEGPDPAEYCPRGYAIVNVDSRGAGDSEGYICIMGKQEGEDGADVIEAVAKMPWCNGNVGLAGNSHLAIVQWFIAAEQPPSLKAIAPWEACSDLFREQFVRGGIFDNGLFGFIEETTHRSRYGLENFVEMHRRHPLSNAYWEDKRADLSKINIPAYITSSYSALVHTVGSVRGWLEIASKDKWLRWDPYQEWYDLWAVQESIDDLAKFFDRYLKGIENDWESTPRVRLSLLKYGENQEPIHYIDAPDYPLPNTDYKQFYLHKDAKLRLEEPTDSAVISYDSESNADFAGFTYTFDKKTQLAGMVRANLFLSCDDMDDMEVYVIIRKLDKQGKEMLNLNLPWSSVPIKSFDEMTPRQRSNLVLYLGPAGMLKASHRAIDEKRSMHPLYPFHPHDREDKIPPGTVVEVPVSLWPMGIEFEAGESLRLQVSGQKVRLQEFSNDSQKGINKGKHHIHLSLQHPSHIVLPFLA
ncbi:alpha/beta-hydrolase [Testicularia cyperi]|uniref:Alpha/beta-hydrolase n=1 Tax=Testicularia cyperi TaxID=1882483 RepID=A0A317XGD1_9BASI|nr:alpha/beta-hydrolase [Testicularia cyperi]